MQREYSAPMLAKEIDNLKEGKSQVQLMEQAISARENCIQDLRKLSA